MLIMSFEDCILLLHLSEYFFNKILYLMLRLGVNCLLMHKNIITLK